MLSRSDHDVEFTIDRKEPPFECAVMLPCFAAEFLNICPTVWLLILITEFIRHINPEGEIRENSRMCDV
jgi:hypothetical protein